MASLYYTNHSGNGTWETLANWNTAADNSGAAPTEIPWSNANGSTSPFNLVDATGGSGVTIASFLIGLNIVTSCNIKNIALTGGINGGFWTGDSFENNGGGIYGGTFSGDGFTNIGLVGIYGGTFTCSNFVNATGVYGGTFSGAGFANNGGGIYGGTFTCSGFTNNGQVNGGFFLPPSVSQVSIGGNQYFEMSGGPSFGSPSPVTPSDVLTLGAAGTLLASFVTSQGPTDPLVSSGINFVNQRFLTSGQFRGNRFIYSFTVQQDSAGNNYIDTIPGIDSVLRVIAVDTDFNGEIGDIISDWTPFSPSGLGFLSPTAGGDLQLQRMGTSPSSPLPSGSTSNTQRYRVLGKTPVENRTLYCLVRRAYVQLVNPTDIIIPNDINAMRYGMMAFNYENNDEFTRADKCWERAYQCLNDSLESFEDGEVEVVEVQTKGYDYHIQNLI